MNPNEYVNNNNYQEKIIYNNNNKIIEEINPSLSNNYSQLEKDILILINYLRTNPLDFCNNIMQKNQYNQNPDNLEIINFIENIHSKQFLQGYIEIPELSEAARNFLDNISLHYKKFHNLNLKELDPASLNLRTRLSRYGERTGRIFETVLFKMDNPEDIVNHILREEKGRNMLLNYKMKYIGIACDLLPSNFLCTVIDIVQDFIPYREKNNIKFINNDIENKNINKTNNTIQDKNNKINNSYNNFNSGTSKKKYFYNKNNNEYMTLINNLNYKNSKDNLKLRINVQEKTSKEIDININDNNEGNIFEINNNKNNVNTKNKYYETPLKLPKTENKENNLIDNLSPNTDNPINIKKIVPKRNNSNNINILKKESKNINSPNEIEDIKNIKFTMAGRTFKQQQEMIEISTKKNLTKSKSVCSFDANSNCSKTTNKNKFQRLNHEEKMEILHKINHKNKKATNSEITSDKFSENGINLIPNKINNIDKNNYPQKIESYEINFDNRSRKSPARSAYYNQEYFDINSETNKYITKNDINYDDGTNQTYTELKSNQGIGNNEEYSKNKINEIKNDLLYFKNQIKKELKEEVREEIRNELLYQNKQRNRPTIINYEGDYDLFNNKIDNERERRSAYDEINEINDKVYYHQTRNNNNNKNREKNRWSSVGKYYYIKNNNNNINNINNTNIIIPNNQSKYSQYVKNNYLKGKNTLDLNDFININRNKGIDLKEKYKEKYNQLSYIPFNNINNNENENIQDNLSVFSRGSYQNEFTNKGTPYNDIGANEPSFNESYRTKDRKEIKKLIRLYNIAKEDQRNKSIIDNNSNYDIINNNKSITNYNFNQSNINNNVEKENSLNNNIKINNNENMNDNGEINSNTNYKISDKYTGYDSNNKNIPVNLKSDFINNNAIYKGNNMNNEEDDYSTENDFVKGHRFQIKYQKVKPKGQIYNKSTIPKPRHSSVQKSNNYANYNINDSKSFINDNGFKNEDIVNLENTNFSNEKEENINKQNNNKEKEYIIEKTSYIKKYNEISTYKNVNENGKKGKNSNLNSNEKLSETGKFNEENNNENNNNLKSTETIDFKNYMDKNTVYKESKDIPIISKTEKLEGNNIITTIVTKTRKIYTPEKRGKPEEVIINKKVHKKQSDLIKEYKKFEKIENLKENIDTRSINSSKNNNNTNKIITKKLSLGRKTYDKIRINNNKNQDNYAEIEQEVLKTPYQFKKSYHQYENEFYNNANMDPRFNNNFSSKTNSYYKKKKYTPYQYYPYEFSVNYNDDNMIPSKRLNYNNNGSIEKKYIKDPEGNLIETYVKKTKYNDGSILLEYV